VLILGVNAMHADASAALLVDGRLVAAVEEERFTRIKHASGTPVEAIRWVLEHAGAKAADLDHVAFSKSPHAHRARRAGHVLVHAARTRHLPLQRLTARRRFLSLDEEIRAALGGPVSSELRTHYVEHHPAHISSAFYASEFDEAAVCSIDGLGDFVSMAWGTGRDRRLDVSNRVFFPHSLGYFYTAVTQLLGFPNYGDEYKVMGLAPYGSPRYLPEMRRVLRASDEGFRLDQRYFRHEREEVEWRVDGGAPVIGTLYSQELTELLGPARLASEPIDERHRDVAASAQARLEEVILPLLARVRASTGMPALCLAGGVALNVTVNSRIIGAETGFDAVFIQPAASDAGTSLGAAMHVAHHQLGAARAAPMRDVYLGPSFSSEQCRDALEQAGLGYERLDLKSLCRRTAGYIAEGRIIGWFQGSMEFGPRALGNRSIVCDPRRSEMKDVLNARTKRREAFRPFAPSVLTERVAELYETDGVSPFMLTAPRVRPEWRDRLGAVTHVDGTGRIQTVDRERNERYWQLISAFEALTGVPALLNTSFNENEPIVCTPKEAIACFLRADMDVLVLEDLLVSRN